MADIFYLFESKADGSLRPRFPRARDGSYRIPDGTHFLSDAQAADRLQVPVAKVRTDWLDTFADVIEGQQFVATIKPDEVEQLARQKFSYLKNDSDFAQVMLVCRERSLHPLFGHVWAGHVYNTYRKELELYVGVTIAGLRLLCRRVARWERVGPRWCDAADTWHKAWTKPNEFPTAARTLIYVEGQKRPFEGVADWLGWAPLDVGKHGEAIISSPIWEKRPAHNLGRCSESVALHAAFPGPTDSLYTPDEMRREMMRAPQEPPFELRIASEVEPSQVHVTEMTFKIGMLKLGINSESHRQSLLERFAADAPELSQEELRARVLEAVKRNPRLYRSAPEHSYT